MENILNTVSLAFFVKHNRDKIDVIKYQDRSGYGNVNSGVKIIVGFNRPYSRSEFGDWWQTAETLTYGDKFDITCSYHGVIFIDFSISMISEFLRSHNMALPKFVCEYLFFRVTDPTENDIQKAKIKAFDIESGDKISLLKDNIKNYERLLKSSNKITNQYRQKVDSLTKPNQMFDKILKIINSNRNAYIINKLSNGELTRDDVKKYPELIDTVDQIEKIKLLTN